METKQVIVIRKDLGMRKGKMIAQGAHASLKAFTGMGYYWSDFHVQPTLTFTLSDDMDDWLMGLSTKVCVSVDSEEELLDIYNKANESNLICSLVKDAGKTEFGGVPTYTAVAVGPGPVDEIDKITGHLKLL